MAFKVVLEFSANVRKVREVPYLVDGLAVAGADVSLDVVDLVRLGVDLVPPFKAVVVEVLCHLLFVFVHQGAVCFIGVEIVVKEEAIL